MPSVLKSTFLGLGLLAGVATVASAQSVSSLPPAGGAVPTATPPVTSSSQAIRPNPGASSNIQEPSYQRPADWESNPSYHPYSSAIGPKIGSHSSGQEQRYQATEQDNAPARHPYTSTGAGPRPN